MEEDTGTWGQIVEEQHAAGQRTEWNWGKLGLETELKKKLQKTQIISIYTWNFVIEHVSPQEWDTKWNWHRILFAHSALNNKGSLMHVV